MLPNPPWEYKKRVIAVLAIGFCIITYVTCWAKPVNSHVLKKEEFTEIRIATYDLSTEPTPKQFVILLPRHSLESMEHMRSNFFYIAM